MWRIPEKKSLTSSSVAPLATAVKDPGERAASLVMLKMPAFTNVAPRYVFAFVRVSKPMVVKFPEPEITPLRVSDPPTVAELVRVIPPETCPPPLSAAPLTPVPSIRSDSRRLPAATVRVAPLKTVVPTPVVPREKLLAATSVPASTSTSPSNVFTPPRASVPGPSF